MNERTGGVCAANAPLLGAASHCALRLAELYPGLFRGQFKNILWRRGSVRHRNVPANGCSGEVLALETRTAEPGRVKLPRITQFNPGQINLKYSD